MHNAKPTTAKGLTLIELIVTLAVLGILVAAAAPNFQGLVLNNRAAASTNEFVTAINIARSEAVEHNRRAIICQSSDPEVSSPSCDGNAGSWHEGWIVFVDGFRGGGVDGIVVSKEIIRVWDGFDGQMTLDGDAAGDNVTRLVFQSSGRRANTNNARFDLEPGNCKGHKVRRRVRVPVGGRPSVDSGLSC